MSPFWKLDIHGYKIYLNSQNLIFDPGTTPLMALVDRRMDDFILIFYIDRILATVG